MHFLTTQEIAVRCIQRNVKAFLGVRDWPWWRLLVRVTPLLNVHRTEEQLKSTIEEMQTLRSKLEKLELERNALKSDNEKLEIKVSMALTSCPFFCILSLGWCGGWVAGRSRRARTLLLLRTVSDNNMNLFSNRSNTEESLDDH